MPSRIEVREYFKSITHPNDKVKVCQRCGRLLNHERIVIRKNKTTIEKLKKLKKPLKTIKWHKFKLCESCFEDKQEKIVCHKVDLEHIELFNLTYAYLHKQL